MASGSTGVAPEVVGVTQIKPIVRLSRAVYICPLVSTSLR